MILREQNYKDWFINKMSNGVQYPLDQKYLIEEWVQAKMGKEYQDPKIPQGQYEQALKDRATE